ncbi:hypothetical protein RFI_16187 [Reticulomyxa filosa]|uniref:Uncharacterized protein n=1 Tax=Reticulomyxa filosa TaxID=46433 RepID=X6N512_RETFI|nr:hypothetical protein RFI_16187 [Reticulomyxa filosa]|eukprot:ETO21018.1 hypothetical protein RFI_16187 [Reticulomyxa filosa]
MEDNPPILVPVFSSSLRKHFKYLNSTGLKANRLKCVSPYHVFFANKQKIYEIYLVYPEVEEIKIERGRQGPHISRPIELKEITEPKVLLTMCCDISDFDVSIVSGCISLTGIDNHGHIQTKHWVPSQKKKVGKNMGVSDDNEVTATAMTMATTNDTTVAFTGLSWSGLCSIDLNKETKEGTTFVASSFEYQIIQMGDISKNTILRTVHLCQKPMQSLFYTPPNTCNPTILCLEGNALSIHDFREKLSTITTVDRQTSSLCEIVLLIYCICSEKLRNEMYDMSIHPNRNHISCVGKDKVVYIIDTRKYQIQTMFKSGAKYELVKCQFSLSSQPTLDDFVYCVGLDHDIMFGKWNRHHLKTHKGSPKKFNDKMSADNTFHSLDDNTMEDKSVHEKRFHECFRGDSKWIGVDFIGHSGMESMIGITENATIYAVRKPYFINPDTHHIKELKLVIIRKKYFKTCKSLVNKYSTEQITDYLYSMLYYIISCICYAFNFFSWLYNITFFFVTKIFLLNLYQTVKKNNQFNKRLNLCLKEALCVIYQLVESQLAFIT